MDRTIRSIRHEVSENVCQFSRFISFYIKSKCNLCAFTIDFFLICVCVLMCECACVYLCAYACVRVCMRVCAPSFHNWLLIFSHYAFSFFSSSFGSKCQKMMQQCYIRFLRRHAFSLGNILKFSKGFENISVCTDFFFYFVFSYSLNI